MNKYCVWACRLSIVVAFLNSSGCAMLVEENSIQHPVNRNWASKRFTQGEMDSYKNKGMNSKDALDCRNKGVDAESCSKLWRAGFELDEGVLWLAKSFQVEGWDGKDSALQWRNKKFTLEQAVLWRDKGFYPDAAAQWRDRGFMPDTAMEEISKNKHAYDSVCNNGSLSAYDAAHINPWSLVGKCAAMEFAVIQYLTKNKGLYSYVANVAQIMNVFVVDQGDREAIGYITGVFVFGQPIEYRTTAGALRLAVPATLVYSDTDRFKN
jgi:hypothetical protein